MDTLHSEQACPPQDAEKHLDEQNLLGRPTARTSQPEVARTVCMLDLVATGTAGEEAAAAAGFLRLPVPRELHQAEQYVSPVLEAKRVDFEYAEKPLVIADPVMSSDSTPHPAEDYGVVVAAGREHVAMPGTTVKYNTLFGSEDPQTLTYVCFGFAG